MFILDVQDSLSQLNIINKYLLSIISARPTQRFLIEIIV